MILNLRYRKRFKKANRKFKLRENTLLRNIRDLHSEIKRMRKDYHRKKILLEKSQAVLDKATFDVKYELGELEQTRGQIKPFADRMLSQAAQFNAIMSESNAEGISTRIDKTNRIAQQKLFNISKRNAI